MARVNMQFYCTTRKGRHKNECVALHTPGSQSTNPTAPHQQHPSLCSVRPRLITSGHAYMVKDSRGLLVYGMCKEDEMWSVSCFTIAFSEH